MKNKITDWLNKTGYPLEMYSGQILESMGYNVYNSHVYYDEENQISRELDLFATKNWNNDSELNLDITFLVECKKSDKPFLLIQQSDSAQSKFDLKSITGLDESITMSFYAGAPCDINFTKPCPVGFKLVPAMTESDKVAYQAINTLIKSTNYFLRNEATVMEDYIKDNVHRITIPLLVVDALFFNVQLDNDSYIINETEIGIIEFRTHLNRFGEDVNYPLLVVKKSYLNKFLDSVNQYGTELFNFLLENPKSNVINSDEIFKTIFGE